jgi:hypothetical protein
MILAIVTWHVLQVPGRLAEAEKAELAMFITLNHICVFDRRTGRSQRNAFRHVEAWFPGTAAAAPFFRLRLRPLRRRCSPACWRWLGTSRQPLQVHKIIEAIHFLSLSAKKYRNSD